MADLKQIEAAFLKADAAGDTEAARVLAGEVRRLRADGSASQSQAAPTSQTLDMRQIVADREARGTEPRSDYEPPSFLSRVGQDIGNAVAGGVRGAGSIGATLMASPKQLREDIFGGGPGSSESRAQMDAGLQSLGADPKSAWYKTGKLGAEIAGTAGAGGALAKGLTTVAPQVAAAAPNLVNAIRTSGMTAGATGSAANALTRVAGGAITGGASAGLVNPGDAGTGAFAGGLIPFGTSVMGKVGSVLGRALRGGSVSPEVAALAGRAKALGIDIPADRLVNSKPLDAIASGLNYLPFSGRAATEGKMASQLNRAASRLMGQDTTNMNQALRAAGADLGAKFDATLKSTGVAFDQQLLNDVSKVYNTAERELGSDALKAITSQVDELVAKGGSGVIDGNAAYNIKRTLDRIGRQNTPAAYHALELKGVLMNALDRSLGPQGSAAFAQTRQQYGNMLALEKLAKNGVEGEISVARLANLSNINNKPLQELADIASQFVKSREGQHGAMQRAMVGIGSGAAAGPAGLAAVAAGGRAANAALNSNAIRGLVMGNTPNALNLAANPKFRQMAYQVAPQIAADQ